MTVWSYAPYGRRLAPPDIPVIVYGTRWCAATQMVRRYLERLGVPYRYVDLELDPQAAQQLRWLTGGYVSHPTVYIGGEILVEPTLRELDWALARSGLR
ncbi:glutaredoxin family protein [Kallotenue papyrolyticum]|uniref:glutaredoxin family protein n=1 Tax=Kallotenue papyrolyticum TaxID=1325125 RepID=UPI0004B50C13|nr:glutaredoxin family protein [Kallotenue papyrolyticum]